MSSGGTRTASATSPRSSGSWDTCCAVAATRFSGRRLRCTTVREAMIARPMASSDQADLGHDQQQQGPVDLGERDADHDVPCSPVSVIGSVPGDDPIAAQLRQRHGVLLAVGRSRAQAVGGRSRQLADLAATAAVDLGVGSARAGGEEADGEGADGLPRSEQAVAATAVAQGLASPRSAAAYRSSLYVRHQDLLDGDGGRRAQQQRDHGDQDGHPDHQLTAQRAAAQRTVRRRLRRPAGVPELRVSVI